MKTITLEEAINILDQCSAVVVDYVVTYPNLEGGEDDDELFLSLSWVDGDFDEFESFFYCGSNREIRIDGSSMFIFDDNAEEIQLTVLCPQKLD